jgi:hypothetical protein
MKMRIRLALVFGLALLLAGTLAAQPTLDEVRESVAKGVAWLAAQQQPDGAWYAWGCCEPVATTGLAVKKLMHHAVDPKWGLGLPSPFDPLNPYKANIEAGLAYLFDNGYTLAIGPQPAGDPDSNGNGIGIAFSSWGSHPTYTSGIALMTICETVELDRVVGGTGPLAGMTYEAVARDLMDYLAFGQNDVGCDQRGGWGYSENYCWGDNSNSGYVTLGLAYAEAAPPNGCGFIVPQFVKDELNLWIDFIQNDVNGDPLDGGSGYDWPENWVNTLKTGNLLQQMAFFGDGVNTQRVQDALDYLERHWYDTDPDPGWMGWGWPPNPASYQATFTIMKGMNAFAIEEFGDPPISWATDFETALVAQQNLDGSWPWCNWGDPILCTSWALLTLQRAAPIIAIPVPVDIRPGSCPNPINVDTKGILPVAILGTDTFDVTQVDPASVLLEGVYPLRWSLEDVSTPYEPFINKPLDPYACNTSGPDGYMDLSLKFDNLAVAAAIAPVTDGEVRILKLTGMLKPEFGGKQIIGEDVVVIIVAP